MYNHYDKGMHPKQSVVDQLVSLMQKQVDGENTMTGLQRVSGAVGVVVFVSVERHSIDVTLPPPLSFTAAGSCRRGSP